VSAVRCRNPRERPSVSAPFWQRTAPGVGSRLVSYGRAARSIGGPPRAWRSDPMAISQLQYVGFRNTQTTPHYQLFVHPADGQSDDFVVAIPHEAFVSGRARYQDGAEICFLKLSRDLAAWAASPESGPPASRQEVTEAELTAYRDGHAPKPRRLTPPP